MQRERSALHAAAYNVSNRILAAIILSEEVEDVSIHVSRSQCINMDVAMLELESAIAAAVPQWMALCVLLVRGLSL